MNTHRPDRREQPKTRHYLMLLSLLAGETHGLALAREVERLSEGRVRLWPAMLYGSLEELCERGWIEEVDGRRGPPLEESERKRVYRITAAGREVARAETRRFADLVKVARSRVKPRGETA
jgi:DNA-binding PadR family transcriptional regulator